MKVFFTDLSDIKENIDLIHRYEEALSPLDKSRYQHMTNENRQLQFLTGRALIYENCGENPTLSKTGKPLISKGYLEAGIVPSFAGVKWMTKCHALSSRRIVHGI